MKLKVSTISTIRAKNAFRWLYT